MAEVVLFTQSYPYAAAMEDTFVEPELPYLKAAFDKVVIVPAGRDGTRARPERAGIEVDESLAARLGAGASRTALARRTLTSVLARDDLRRHPRLLASPAALARLVACVGRAEIVRDWMRDRGGAQNTVAYTFWCDHITAGLCAAKRELPALVIASRAHGIDLYPERHDPPYLPCRDFTLEHLDCLFPDSERGARYVAHAYPWFATRCQPALMGVPDPGFVTRHSTDSKWSIVSCSRLVAVKRPELIVRGIAEVARRDPHVEIVWTHFGEGALRADIEALASTEFPANARADFKGYPSHDALMEFYRTQPIDLFMNTSSSEGTPVSIMEAVSCGIPVIATDVGGNGEIVGEQNGVLLSANPTPAEIAAAILSLVEDRELAARKRTGSRTVWDTRYNADRNYTAFARRLAELRTT